MADLKLQRRLAAKIGKVGENNVKIPQEHLDEVSEALTRSDVRKLIREGKLIIEHGHRVSRGRFKERSKKMKLKSERKGEGSRNGKKSARQGNHLWVNKIRKIRRYLKWLRDNNVIDSHTYRQMYKKSKGGAYNNLNEVRAQLIQMGKIKG
ncbi:MULTISPECIES: 50S ribosomal protein L19e [Acidianus]|uniref:Large ribosomal subunit protein eL19 n=1 Tax=Candidatus Acidianus copahuensis TaxID=1160895 RepID=A0A031LN43_9CREN|nr:MULTISPECIES: 50S ribosomal protein L19e [Acidianus]EZQ03845.1 50S ribosomal protein L19 [Candidatus Acidianus copahuensis]NON62524.1 50S ribosomal protein L19e [Acidianus sp. RZ1]